MWWPWTKFRRLREEVERWQTRYNTAVKTAENDRKALNKRIDILTGTQSTIAGERDSLAAEVQTLKQDCKATQEASDKLREALTNANKGVEKIAKQRDGLQEDLKAAQAEITEKDNELATVCKDRDELSGALEVSKKDAANYRSLFETEQKSRENVSKNLQGHIDISKDGKSFTWRLLDPNRTKDNTLATQSIGRKSKTADAAKDKLRKFLTRLRLYRPQMPCSVERLNARGEVVVKTEALQ